MNQRQTTTSQRSLIEGGKHREQGRPNIRSQHERQSSVQRNDILRSEEHTSELQSHHDLVCRLLLEKKNERLALSPARLASGDARRLAAIAGTAHLHSEIGIENSYYSGLCGCRLCFVLRRSFAGDYH